MIHDKRGKGEMGLDKAIGFLLAFAILVILGFIILIILGNLLGNGSILGDYSTAEISETAATVTEVGTDLVARESSSYYLPICTINSVTNLTAGGTVGATTNYTTTNSGCTLVSAGSEYNGSGWITNYSVDYKDTKGRDVIGNSTVAISDFFTNASTWLTLLSVVIILLIVSVVIFVVKRFGGGDISGSKSIDKGSSGFAKL